MANYAKAEALFMRAFDNERTLVMQSYYQFAIDDFAELGLEVEANATNKVYKDTLRKYYDKDNLFYIAYTIDIVA